MHGNVWEWVEDCYDENAYKKRSELLVDPVVGGSCQSRVLRGGSTWLDDPRELAVCGPVRDEPEVRAVASAFAVSAARAASLDLLTSCFFGVILREAQKFL